jgi:hypothetical protein
VHGLPYTTRLGESAVIEIQRGKSTLSDMP